jgi:hypothetical protein
MNLTGEDEMNQQTNMESKCNEEFWGLDKCPGIGVELVEETNSSAQESVASFCTLEPMGNCPNCEE